MNGSHEILLPVMILAFSVCLLIGNGAVALLRSRKQAMQQSNALRMLEKVLDLLARNTDDVFLLFSADTYQAQYVSSNVQRVLGVRVEAVREDVRTLANMLAEGESSFLKENLEAIEEDAPWVNQRVYRRPDTGDLRWFKGSIHCVSVESQKQLFLMTLSDRSQEQGMNRVLRETLDAANAANESKRNFLANMSHDIRTPMNAIVGFSSLLEQYADKPDKVREYTRKIMSSSQHLLGLINDVLDMSKIESGKTSLNSTAFSLPELLDELMGMLTYQAQMRSQTLELHTKGILPEQLVGDKLRLKQILSNLLTNALKYTQDGGEIQMVVEALPRNKQDYVSLRFIVEDNGCGMSPEFLKKIFDPFARERKMHANEVQGTGLGMPIANTLVQLMGGTISVQSMPGVGSMFTVELMFPLAEQDSDSGFWSKYGIRRVLVVDGQEEVCRNIQLMLKEVGVQADYATSSHQAVELAEQVCGSQQGYQVVLVDWKLADPNGQEAARHLRKVIDAQAPVVMLVPYHAVEIEESAKVEGVDILLPKPFFLSYFRQALAEHFDYKTSNHAKEDVSIAGVRVLAAEDHSINADLLVQLLCLLDVSCHMASNGQEALEQFLSAPPGYYDLIIMDVQMPVMDGYEATRRIRESGRKDAKDIPIIAMTANAFQDDVKAALDAGMTAHAAKPIGKEKLKNLVWQYAKKRL